VPDNLPKPDPANPSWALFLDVDGTLLEIADHPERVLVPNGLVEMLGDLDILFEGAVALISGRELSALDKLLGWENRDAAGCHGGEIRLAGTILNAAATDVLEIATRRLHAAVAAMPRTWVECKSQATAFHFGDSEMSVDIACRTVKHAVLPYLDELRVLSGKNVVEVLPRHNNKGAAISRFLSRAPYFGRTPVFVGDDSTDEDGFAEVNRRGGISVVVGGRKPTAANFSVQSVSDVHKWLARLLAIGARSPKGWKAS
jgi:trehalose 6-phosphate phosphatase